MLVTILLCFASHGDSKVIHPSVEIARLLDVWHMAAAKADEETYFKYLSDEAIYLGTDATERWTKEEFRKFAHPYFAKGKAWTFEAVKRGVHLSKDGKIAWFDEELKTQNLGPARGSGVLVLEKDGWRIVQYNLSITIPNERFDAVKKLLEASAKAK